MKFIKIGAIASILFLLGGCSVYMAAHQPTKKDVSLFRVGTPRDALIAEFGVPVTSGVKDGKKYEIYRFTQGYTEGAKTARALAEGTADVFTLGVSEVVTTPVESLADGNLMVYEVTYDSNDCVDQVTNLTPGAGNASPAQTAPASNNPQATSPPAQSTVQK